MFSLPPPLPPLTNYCLFLSACWHSQSLYLALRFCCVSAYQRSRTVRVLRHASTLVFDVTRTRNGEDMIFESLTIQHNSSWLKPLIEASECSTMVWSPTKLLAVTMFHANGRPRFFPNWTGANALTTFWKMGTGPLPRLQTYYVIGTR